MLSKTDGILAVKQILSNKNQIFLCVLWFQIETIAEKNIYWKHTNTKSYRKILSWIIFVTGEIRKEILKF